MSLYNRRISNDAKKASEEAKSKYSTSSRSHDVRCEGSGKRVEQEQIVIQGVFLFKNISL